MKRLVLMVLTIVMSAAGVSACSSAATDNASAASEKAEEILGGVKEDLDPVAVEPEVDPPAFQPGWLPDGFEITRASAASPEFMSIELTGPSREDVPATDDVDLGNVDGPGGVSEDVDGHADERVDGPGGVDEDVDGQADEDLDGGLDLDGDDGMGETASLIWGDELADFEVLAQTDPDGTAITVRGTDATLFTFGSDQESIGPAVIWEDPSGIPIVVIGSSGISSDDVVAIAEGISEITQQEFLDLAIELAESRLAEVDPSDE